MTGLLDEPLPQFNGEEYDPQEMRGLVQILERALSKSGLRQGKVTVVAGPSYNMQGDDEFLAVDHTDTAAVGVNLVTARFMKGRRITITDTGGNASANNITITPPGSETISGAATYTINVNFGSVTLWCDERDWLVESIV